MSRVADTYRDLCHAGSPHWLNPKMKAKVGEQSDSSVHISLQGTVQGRVEEHGPGEARSPA